MDDRPITKNVANDDNSDETRPLLVSDQENQPLPPPDPQKPSAWSRSVRVILWLFPLVLLGLLIKAFIDAGEFEFDLGKALKSALGGGLTGAAAMVLQVLTLMPLRTIVNHQYRYGQSMAEVTRNLYQDGGWTRFYQGLSAALIQGPVSRFGDTAAYEGVLSLLDSNPTTAKLPEWFRTFIVSLTAAAFRIFLTPVDTVKTTLQVHGRSGMQVLRNRIRMYGIGTLWYGAIATAAATFVGNYPWSTTLRYLDKNLPKTDDFFLRLCRSALIGFCASAVSDTVSNSLRVVKTYRQVNETRIAYWDAAAAVIATDGVLGLLGRGLKTKILANGLQGLMFNVLWRWFLEIWESKT